MPTPLPDPICVWMKPDRKPTLKTDEVPGLIMIIQNEDGYVASGEYDHKTRSFWLYKQCFDDHEEIYPGMNADDINQNLEWELEESETVLYWMWVERPPLSYIK